MTRTRVSHQLAVAVGVLAAVLSGAMIMVYAETVDVRGRPHAHRLDWPPTWHWVWAAIGAAIVALVARALLRRLVFTAHFRRASTTADPADGTDSAG
ncbi:hypothetical protein SAMN04488550_2381 [Gordonia malaquae]|uniref:hypothetical protein n=1 Tax=Gordonia malaquae TaxID=410332 RepID=UPI000344F2D8|nr:hypothetical protein [Gordonia malaquae]SED35642.1 hypothetical protein SAMN04488550_2381 [Gordonia malaquae]